MRWALLSSLLVSFGCRSSQPPAPTQTPSISPTSVTGVYGAVGLDEDQALRQLRDLLATLAGNAEHDQAVRNAVKTADDDETFIDAALVAAARLRLAEEPGQVVREIGREWGHETLVAFAEAHTSLRVLAVLADTKPDALPEEVRPHIEQARQRWMARRQAIWDAWLDLPLPALAAASNDPRIEPTLRRVQALMGVETELASFSDSLDPKVRAFGQQLAADEAIFGLLTGDREREQYLRAARARWTERAPTDSAPAAIPEASFGVVVQNAGDGTVDLTFVLEPALDADELRRALLRSLILQNLFAGSVLMAAGLDFSELDADGDPVNPDMPVPRKYRLAYAGCGSAAALDTLLWRSPSPSPLLAGLQPSRPNEELLDWSHQCVLDAAGDAISPARPGDLGGRGAMSRLVLFALLASFEESPKSLRSRDTTAD